MEKITAMQKLFAQLLVKLNMSKDSTIVVGLMLQKNNQIAEMVKFIENNPKVTEEEILQRAVEISKNCQ